MSKIKEALRNLLNSFINHEPDAAVQADIAYFEDALDAGVFDCLVEHPGSEPPDDRRNVQVKCTRYPGWITAYCEYAGTWLTVPGLYSAGDVSIWRELPPEESK